MPDAAHEAIALREILAGNGENWATLSRLWLTRMDAGDYMLTAARPEIVPVRGAGRKDAYMKPGDPIGLLHCCPLGIHRVFGLTAAGLRHLEPERVEIAGRVLAGSGR